MNSIGFYRKQWRGWLGLTLLFFIGLSGLTSVQGAAILGGEYKRYGRVAINTHGASIPAPLLHYIQREGELLIIKNQAIGIGVPEDFYFQLDFLPDFNSYQSYGASIGVNIDRGMLGFTRLLMSRNQKTGDSTMEPQHPSQIVCYFTQEMPWETVPTLLHEMNHAVHAANYGVMPVWLQEGMSEWFANRKYILGVSKKIGLIASYQRYMPVVDKMDLNQFAQFFSATTYDQWEKHLGDVPMCYFLAQTLVDFFMQPAAQPYFRAALRKAKLGSEWQFQRTLIFMQDITANWPGGENMLLKGWKSWYKQEAKPKRTDKLDPYLDANRKHFHELVREVRGKKVVTDAARYGLVSQWLAFKRLEMDDLEYKINESFNLSESILIRAKQWHVQQFATLDHNARLSITKAHRKHLKETQFNPKDPLYKRGVPYVPITSYLGLGHGKDKHPRPAFEGSTGLPPPNFRWTGLDAWQASMIFTNLFTSFIGRPEGLPAPKLRTEAQGPFTQALRANGMDATAALKAIGGKLDRDPLTGHVTKLTLARTRIDNDDLEHLALLFQPHKLDLSDTDITDSAWTHLVGWAGLRSLNLSRTRISAETVEGWKRYSPGMDILPAP